MLPSPTQPNEAFYDVTHLEMVTTFSRATYKTTFGKQAPAWIPANRIKKWFIGLPAGTDPRSACVIKMVTKNAKGEPIIAPYMGPNHPVPVTWEWVSQTNLPGMYEYPRYVIAPTPAVLTNLNGSTFPFFPDFLASKEQALELAKEFNNPGEANIKEGALGEFNTRWNGEERRSYLVRYPRSNDTEVWLTVGLLMKAKNAQGIGAPGKWELANEPIWRTAIAPNDVGEFDVRPHWPIPVRDLLPNEKLHMVSPFSFLVVRTDMESIFNPKPGGGGTGGGVDEGTKVLIQEIDTRVRNIETGVMNLLARG